MKAPKVSVIIPVYKAERTLERCVDSIANGSYKAIEIILIEDCSPDSSWEICKKLNQKYSFVRIFRNSENHGVSYTRNHGLQVANGKYIMFVDSDDWVDSNYVNVPVDLAERSGCDMIIFGYMNHDQVHNHTTDAFGWDSFSDTKDVEYKELFEIYEGRFLQQLWNKVFRANIILENQIKFDESSSMGEDFKFILEYLMHCSNQKIILLNKILYHYNRDNENSLMYTYDYADVEAPLETMKKLYILMGFSGDNLKEKLEEERKKIVTQYAYFILRGNGFSARKKKKRIIELGGKKLYRSMILLLIKEKVAAVIGKIR